MPVAKIMKFYREHMGNSYLQANHAPDGLDVTAIYCSEFFGVFCETAR